MGQGDCGSESGRAGTDDRHWPNGVRHQRPISIDKLSSTAHYVVHESHCQVKCELLAWREKYEQQLRAETARKRVDASSTPSLSASWTRQQSHLALTRSPSLHGWPDQLTI